ncbi:MAG: TonB-dependent receptor [Gemmatimonadetes bacterium]|nr:TonB-dependent receptor [Gemmatimonadota bacterium]
MLVGVLVGVLATGRPAMLAAAPAGAASRADPRTDCLTQVVLPERRTVWGPPLDRPVSLRAPDMALREALEGVARQAGVSLTYSAELLPEGRRRCVALDRVPLGAVLEALLGGSTLHPVVVGAAEVVLAPARAARTPATVAAVPAYARRVSALDRVVVTGTPDGGAQRGSPFALEVITGEQLARHQANSLAEALELAVPGMWSWTTAAGTVLARYGSIRGASSFAVSAPKIYLDGVEVANPLLVTQLDPSRVERVEVIRGPQGAALYGADAISGVVQILTRHDGAAPGTPRAQLVSAAGVAATAYAPRDAFVQDHALSFRAGNSARGLGVGLSLGSTGAVVPGAAERRALGDLSVRQTFARTVVTGTARLSLQAAGASTGPVLAAALPVVTTAGAGGVGRALLGDSATGQQLAQYTVGATAAFMPTLRWTHTLIAGVDGYALKGLSGAALAAPVGSASLLGEGEGSADRLSVRYRAVGRYDVAPATLLTVSMGAEQAAASELYAAGGGVVDTRVPDTRAAAAAAAAVPPRPVWSANRGVWAQAALAVGEQWYLSAGARAERTTGATPTPQQALVPMVGVAWVRERAGALLKLRGAYGTGIRPARTPMRGSSWLGVASTAGLAALEPETQRGVEFGGDLLLGEGASLHVTRFQQRADGLIQPVATVSAVAGAGPGAPVRSPRVLSFALQNVGAIDNQGWELQGSARRGALSLSGMLTLVDSRVAQTTRGYRGDLRPGDRMLDVPARTLSLAAAWHRGRWALHSGVTHAADWVTYDRSAIAVALERGEGDEGARAMAGGQLRGFWARPPSVTRWRAGATVRLAGALHLQLNGENLLNIQRGLPDDGTVVAGRTLTLGVRTQF